jgi:HEAT repeat protein
MPSVLSPMKRQIIDVLDPSKTLTSSKLVSLSNLSSEEVEFLTKNWPGTDLQHRREISSQLVHLSDVDLKLNFSAVFILCLSDTDEEIRTQAATGLEGEDNYLIINPLLKALKGDTSARVKSAVAVTLGKFALQGELGNLPSHYSEKVYRGLLKVLDETSEPVDVKRRALEAVSPYSRPEVKNLIEAAYHTDDVRLKASAVFAMGRNCDLAWLPTLLIELDSDQIEIRYEAASALGELGAEKAVSKLIDKVSDKDERVREAAIKALGEIGTEPAKLALIKLMNSSETTIRDAAESALKEIQFCEDPLYSPP